MQPNAQIDRGAEESNQAFNLADESRAIRAPVE
jgi:hypothetical protein